MQYLKEIGGVKGRKAVYYVLKGAPAYGYIAFGIIDRGTNVLQVRPTTICPLNCIFCSVDAGPFSRRRWAEYIVDPEVIIKGVKEAVRYKGSGLEALIDTIGDPLTYPFIIDLIYELKKLPGISSIALETHGALLTRNIVDRLSEAGLDRVNLSLDTLNHGKARYLYGVDWFDLDRVIKVSTYLVKETDIDLHVTPLWIPGVNDEDVIDVIKWALRIGAGKRWPPVTVQKYNVHRFGRRVKGVKPWSWERFWRELEKLENKLGVRLRWSMDEWGMRYMPRIPIIYRVGDIVEAYIIGRGIFRGEYLGVEPLRRRYIAVVKAGGKCVGRKVLVEIISNKDGLYIGKTLRCL